MARQPHTAFAARPEQRARRGRSSIFGRIIDFGDHRSPGFEIYRDGPSAFGELAYSTTASGKRDWEAEKGAVDRGGAARVDPAGCRLARFNTVTYELCSVRNERGRNTPATVWNWTPRRWG